MGRRHGAWADALDGSSGAGSTSEEDSDAMCAGCWSAPCACASVAAAIDPPWHDVRRVKNRGHGGGGFWGSRGVRSIDRCAAEPFANGAAAEDSVAQAFASTGDAEKSDPAADATPEHASGRPVDFKDDGKGETHSANSVAPSGLGTVADGVYSTTVPPWSQFLED